MERPDHPTRRCASRGCHNTTRCGKPYCSEHVTEHDYVRWIEKQLAKRAWEVQYSHHMTPEGRSDTILASEILRQIDTHGPRTAERLARDTALPEHVVQHLLEALVSTGTLIPQTGKTRPNTFYRRPAAAAAS